MSPITIGISIVVTLGIAISSALSSRQSLNASKGSTAASELQAVSSALHNYVLNNTTALINSNAVVAGANNVVNVLSPTVDELKTMSLLPGAFLTTPTYGESFLTSISFPNTCTTSTNACPISELVYYKKPFLSEVSNNALDIHVLGSAVTSSTEKNIGFSSTNNAGFISGPGWQIGNPVTTPAPGAIGILGAYKFYSYNASLNIGYNWKSPVDAVSNLPTANNVAGDVRYVKSINTAFYWDANNWLNLNSSAGNTVSLGANASSAGTNNTNIGVNAGLSSSINSQSNTHIGYNAGTRSLGSGNTTIGASSGSSATNATNNNNTIIGSNSANTLSSSNLTVVGSNVTVSAGVNNSIAIGNGINLTSSNTAYIGSATITSLVTSATYSAPSDFRLKSNIRASPYGLSFTQGLQPVEYTLSSNPRRQTGFIAQDVEKIAPEFPGLIKPSKDTPYYALSYTSFIPSLVQSVQELDEKIYRTHIKNSQNTAFIQYMLMGATLILLIMLSVTWWTYQKLKGTHSPHKGTTV